MGNCATGGPPPKQSYKVEKEVEEPGLTFSDEPPPHRRSISMNPLKRQNSIILKKEALLPVIDSLLLPDSKNEQVEVFLHTVAHLKGSWHKGLRNVETNQITLVGEEHRGKPTLKTNEVNKLGMENHLRLRYEIEDEVRIPLQYGKDAGRVLKAMVLRKDRNDGTYWVRIQSSKLSEKRGHVDKIIKVEHTHLLTNDAYKKRKRESKESAAITAVDNSDTEPAGSVTTPTDNSQAGEAEEGSISGQDEAEDTADVDLSSPVEMSDVKRDMEDVPPLKAEAGEAEPNTMTSEGGDINAAHSDLSE